jgi:tetratricopeptide (TPR) repeat protein
MEETFKIEGNNYFKIKDYHNAINSYTKAIKIKPTEILYINRALSYMRLEQHEDALGDVENSLQIKKTKKGKI